jgi:hypothetical protein
MATLATWCPSGGLLAIVAPLALAAAVGDALVVDLDVDGPAYPGEGSLAELVEDGPRFPDLRPGRSGVAVLRNGGVRPEAAREVITALIAGWPNVVFRLGKDVERSPMVPVIPLFPGGFTERWPRPAVYQQMGWGEKAPGPGLTMPTPSRSTVTALLDGRQPLPGRWLAAWQQVWGVTWEL